MVFIGKWSSVLMVIGAASFIRLNLYYDYLSDYVACLDRPFLFLPRLVALKRYAFATKSIILIFKIKSDFCAVSSQHK